MKADYIFFLRPCGLFINIDIILGHKAYHNTFQRIEIICCLLSNHDEIELDIKNRKTDEKSQYTWKLNNMLLKKTLQNNSIVK